MNLDRVTYMPEDEAITKLRDELVNLLHTAANLADYLELSDTKSLALEAANKTAQTSDDR